MHRARKRFGQNFLHDEHVIRQIGAATGITAQDHAVEIGPGRGALTEALLETGAKVTVIELDRDLPPILRARFFKVDPSRFHIIEADALKFDFAALGSPEAPLKLVGNLPYNISTPLIFQLLNYRHVVKDMHFMLQKEVVDRMCAEPGNSDYGRLSVMVQYFCETQPLFKVPPGAFTPQPKVESAIVRLTPRKTPDAVARNPDQLATLVRLAFSQRRKTIRNNLKNHIDLTALDKVNIDPGQRPETISMPQYVDLSNQVTEFQK